MTIAENAPYDLKNSKLHLPLKDRPGEAGAENHVQNNDDATLTGDVKKAIEDADADTQLADALKSALDADAD